MSPLASRPSTPGRGRSRGADLRSLDQHEMWVIERPICAPSRLG